MDITMSYWVGLILGCAVIACLPFTHRAVKERLADPISRFTICAALGFLWSFVWKAIYMTSRGGN